MSDEIRLPPWPSATADLPEIRAYLSALHEWLSVREPLADGGVLDKFLTGRNAVDLGVGRLVAGTPGNGGGELLPGPGTTNPSDQSRPINITGLTVTPGVSYFFVEFDAPVYTQGGGNGRTIIYAATYPGTGPLPTFANAVEVYQCFGASNIAVVDAEPGAQVHFWAKAETRARILQPDPTGGTNGVSAICGQIDGGTNQIKDATILNAKIVSLSVAKLTAGSIAVGEYAQSTGFLTGVSGWQIKGDGTAEFSGVIVRGTIYATAGLIGGVALNGDAIYSPNFDGVINGSGVVTNFGTQGFALTKAGQLVIDATHVRGQRFTSGRSEQPAYSGSAASSFASNHSFAQMTLGGYIVQAGCTGTVKVYIDTDGPVLCECAMQIVAVRTSDLAEVEGPATRDTRILQGGLESAVAGENLHEIPISLSWMFSGDYTLVRTRAYGTAGIPLTPVVVANALNAAQWTLFLRLTVSTTEVSSPYGPETVITHARVDLGGWAMELKGAQPAASPSLAGLPA